MDIAQSHFELFALPARQSLDGPSLDVAYRDMQVRVHPDRFAHAGAMERRVALQWSTRINEAYQTLKDPVKRAAYLCTLRGTDPMAREGIHPDPEFLTRQLELREAIEEAKEDRDGSELQRLQNTVAESRRELLAQLEQRLDVEGNVAAAAGLVRQLMFLDKLVLEISDATSESAS